MSAAPMSQTPGRNVLNDADKHKMQQDIAKIKSDSENSSKIVDKNGERAARAARDSGALHPADEV